MCCTHGGTPGECVVRGCVSRRLDSDLRDACCKQLVEVRSLSDEPTAANWSRASTRNLREAAKGVL